MPKYSVGEEFKLKVKKVVENLKKRKADFQFITASENNAWLLNIRGHDTKYTPIPNSHIFLDKNKNINYFFFLNKISKNLKKKYKTIKFINLI